MAFRVLILGGRIPVTYARLRDALDVLLANRLPDVVILTAGGPGVPALAASYTRSRGLELVAVPPDHVKHRGNAEERQAEVLVGVADAVVVVWDGTGVHNGIVARARAKGIPVRVLGAA